MAPQELYLDDLPDVCEALSGKPTVKRSAKAWKSLELHEWEVGGGYLDIRGVAAAAMSAVELKQRGNGSVLVFLPGVNEIGHVKRELERLSHGSLWILSLHGGASTKEQVRKPSIWHGSSWLTLFLLSSRRSVFVLSQTAVFKKPPPGKVKVVLSTNVAETSITIDDVTVVVDSGRAKETEYDAQSQVSESLLLFLSSINGIPPHHTYPDAAIGGEMGIQGLCHTAQRPSRPCAGRRVYPGVPARAFLQAAPSAVTRDSAGTTACPVSAGENSAFDRVQGPTPATSSMTVPVPAICMFCAVRSNC